MFQEAYDKGQVLLVGIIVVGVAALLVASSFMLLGLNSLRGVTTANQSAQASMLGMACAEEALYRIHQSPSYVGSDSYTLEDNECLYSVVDIGGGQKKITLSGTVGSVVRKIEIIITVNGSEIIINSWQDVP